ncbi:MAG: Na+/H+ antiporter subunit E [Nitriliruptoraceae bacterium]
MTRLLRTLGMFVALLGFWQILSARIDPLFAVLGILSAAVLTAYALWLVEKVLGPREQVRPISALGFVVFAGWMLTRMLQSAVWVATVVLDPRRRPHPGVVHFDTGLPSPAARTMLANSISLVPGTITLNVDGQRFTVHAFTPESVEDLATAATQQRIARVFKVAPDAPPAMDWDPVHDELPEDPA